MKTNSAAAVETLSILAPSIAFSVDWTEDLHFRWDGDGKDPKRNGYLPHDVTVTARMILQGKLSEGHSYLGGSYDKPGKLCPEVHGYWLQMAREAVEELPESVDRNTAVEYLKQAMHAAWEAQQQPAA